MDDFDVDHAYQATGDRLVIADDDATFTDFAASPETVFTRGDADAIRFTERPMWLRVDTSGEDAIAIEAHDATDAGQAVRVDASWLEGHGVEGEPLAYYHDGTPIPVEPTNDGTAYRIEAPHFSHIYVASPDLDTSWKTEDHTRFLDIKNATISSEFNITVANETASTISFEFWSVINGSENTFDGFEPFEKVGRESLNRSGYYTFNFINETNLANGYTTLGRERFELVKVNLTADTYDFSDGNMTYQFDQTTGYLVRVHDDQSASEISVRDAGLDLAPKAGTDSVHDPGRTPVWLVSKGTRWNLAVVCHNDTESIETVYNPRWTGGDPDETIPGNILSTRNEIRAKAKIDVEAEVVDRSCSDAASCSDEQPCHENSGCHLKTTVNNASGPDNDDDHGWAVKYDESHDDDDTVVDAKLVGNSEQFQAVCGDCPFSSVTTSWIESELGQHSLDGVEHQSDLFDRTWAQFWACGRREVWENGGPTTGTKVHDTELCESAFDQNPSDPTGRIYVDPCVDLPCL